MDSVNTYCTHILYIHDSDSTKTNKQVVMAVIIIIMVDASESLQNTAAHILGPRHSPCPSRIKPAEYAAAINTTSTLYRKSDSKLSKCTICVS